MFLVSTKAVKIISALYSRNFFPLAVQRNSSLGRLHETFHFPSVTSSRTVGRTPWTGDHKAFTCTQTQKNAHTTQTLNIHALIGIQTHDLGVCTSEDSSCLRPPGHHDRYIHIILKNKTLNITVKWIAFLLYIQKVVDSKLSLETILIFLSSC
jgi:hypothetical protein